MAGTTLIAAHLEPHTKGSRVTNRHAPTRRPKRRLRRGLAEVAALSVLGGCIRPAPRHAWGLGAGSPLPAASLVVHIGRVWSRSHLLQTGTLEECEEIPSYVGLKYLVWAADSMLATHRRRHPRWTSHILGPLPVQVLV